MRNILGGDRMPKGWITIHRELSEHWLWKDKPFSFSGAWVDLIMMANHKDGKFPLGEEIIHVKRGSFITSQKKLSERWGWSRSKVNRFLKLLENDAMIELKSDNKKTALTICNYSDYQDVRTANEHQKDIKPTSNQHQTDTNNNDNNDNNDLLNNIVRKTKSFLPPARDELKSYCIEKSLSFDVDQFIDFYESKGWMVGKTKMKDWKAAARNWNRRNYSRSKVDKLTVEPNKRYTEEELEAKLLNRGESKHE